MGHARVSTSGRRARPSTLAFVAAIASLTVSHAVANAASLPTPSWSIDRDRSMLAVVTRKAGLAARLAHDHLIVASRWDGTIAFDPRDPGRTEFAAVIDVSALAVDRTADHARFERALSRIGLREQPFTELSPKQRGKVERAMRSKGQLDAERHATVSVRVRSVVQDGTDPAFPFRATLAMTVRGVEVETPARARFRLDGDRLTIEGRASFLFSEFGIEPYSALLGAVRNRDAFDVAIVLVAERAIAKEDR